MTVLFLIDHRKGAKGILYYFVPARNRWHTKIRIIRVGFNKWTFKRCEQGVGNTYGIKKYPRMSKRKGSVPTPRYESVRRGAKLERGSRIKRAT